MLGLAHSSIITSNNGTPLDKFPDCTTAAYQLSLLITHCTQSHPIETVQCLCVCVVSEPCELQTPGILSTSILSDRVRAWHNRICTQLLGRVTRHSCRWRRRRRRRFERTKCGHACGAFVLVHGQHHPSLLSPCLKLPKSTTRHHEQKRAERRGAAHMRDYALDAFRSSDGGRARPEKERHVR